MFGIGPSELIFILVIALLVLGPKRLPELAAGIGKGLAEFRRATADINAELDEARRSLDDQAREATRTTQAPLDRRVSRVQRTTPRGSVAAAKAEASSDESDQDIDEQKETPDTDPKASA